MPGLFSGTLTPSPCQVKQALFSILREFDILRDDAVALDTFAGCGSVGIEALSQVRPRATQPARRTAVTTQSGGQWRPTAASAAGGNSEGSKEAVKPTPPAPTHRERAFRSGARRPRRRRV